MFIVSVYLDLVELRELDVEVKRHTVLSTCKTLVEWQWALRKHIESVKLWIEGSKSSML